jgi:hypothetical protein
MRVLLQHPDREARIRCEWVARLRGRSGNGEQNVVLLDLCKYISVIFFCYALILKGGTIFRYPCA